MKTIFGSLAMFLVTIMTFVSCEEKKANPEYVDLGLPSGTLWATFNVGANKPEEFGDYFAWGETEPKKTYTKVTCKWSDGADGYNKYTHVDSTSLLPEDDAATANWGVEWQMPTKKEVEELMTQCKYEWTDVNGVPGVNFTGPNGNSIFIPAAGGCLGSGYYEKESTCCLWSSSRENEIEIIARVLFVSLVDPNKVSGKERYIGHPVRPVYAKKFRVEKKQKPREKFVMPANASDIVWPNENTKNDVNSYHEYVDLNLPSGLLWATCNVGATKPEENGAYFAWGETVQKKGFYKSNYKWYKGVVYSWGKNADLESGDSLVLTKYCFDKKGHIDHLLTLQPEDDAASVNWGGDWRMPTAKEFEELVENCKCEWKMLNGVNGLVCTSSNGKSVFFPAKGDGLGSSCWTSSLYENDDMIAYIFNTYYDFDFGRVVADPTYAAERDLGLSVRPVKKKK